MLPELQIPIYVAPWSYARDVLHSYPTWARWEAEGYPVGEPSDIDAGFPFRVGGRRPIDAELKTGSSTQTLIETKILCERLAASAGDGGE